MMVMIPCPSCNRHLREVEVACPFCGARQRAASLLEAPGVAASLGAFALVAAMLGTSACVRDPLDANASSTTTTTSTTTDDSVETSTDDGTESLTDPTTTTDPSGSFYAGPEVDTQPAPCDPFVQDCPEGEKCMPVSSTGETWDSNLCLPILGDGATGDPCNYAGIVAATDDCYIGEICWNTQEVDGALVGTCHDLCQGSLDAPTCPDGSVCLIANAGVITVCMQTCDPLMQACPEGQSCAWTGSLSEFVCLVDASDDPQGQPCNDAGACDTGLACVSADVVPNCDSGNGCCTAWCDTTDQDACVDLGLACLPYFEQGAAPMGYETLGVCGDPGP